MLVLLPYAVLAGFGYKKIANLTDKLKETSGLALIDGKYLISHNDGGNKNDVFVLNLKGELLKVIEVDEASNNDWEDLTTDDQGKLYIGDFGNNLNKRSRCFVYILRRNFISDKNQRVNADKISFTYEDQKEFPPDKKELNFDAEAFFWMNDSLYILTKCRSKPFTGISNIYVIPDKPGEYVARKLGSIYLCSSNWQFCSVTSADYYAPTRTLAVLVYSKLYLITDFEGSKFWEGKMMSLPLPGIKQREAVCFQNGKSIFITDEYRKGIGGGNLYQLSLD